MFNENLFRQLIDETKNTVIALGTTSYAVLKRHQKCAEQLIEYLKSLNCSFDRDLCLQWIDCMEHDSASALTSSYVEWIACRRYVILLAEQEAGTLNSWKHYLSQQPKMPKTQNFLEILTLYRAHLFHVGFREATVDSYTSYARRLLMYMETLHIFSVAEIHHKELAGYFASKRFAGRKPKGIQSEACSLKNFIGFLVESGHTDSTSLHCAIPHYRVPIEKIITTITPEIELDIMADEPNSLVDKRDKAVCLLALHIGLRSCDIRNLKFDDIDWEKGVLAIQRGCNFFCV